MKRFLPMLLLLAGIVAFCVWSTRRVDTICGDAAALLEQAETSCALGDFQEAEALVMESRELWLRHEGFLGMALRHTESDDIYMMYSPLLETCRHQDTEDFNQRNLELRAALKQLSRMEQPYYFNIL